MRTTPQVPRHYPPIPMKRKASTALARPTKKPKTRNPLAVTQAKRLSALQDEQKYNDATFNADATSTGTVTALSTIAAGDTVLTREGNKILVTAIELRAIMQLESTNSNAIVRWILVHDKNANGVSPTFAQVLVTTNVSSWPVIGGKSRFTILMDKTVECNSTVTTAPGQFYLHKFVKVPTHLQISAFADGGSGVPVSGSFTLLYFSNQAAGVADVDIEGQTRLYFKG